MRREHTVTNTNTDGYIAWLRSIGCVFYFDAANGDSRDQINDVPLTLSGNGTFTYDSTERAFRCKTPSSANQYIGIWNNGMTSSTFPNDNWTSINIMKAITKSRTKYLPSFGVNSFDRSYAPQFCSFWNQSNKTTNFPDGIFSTASVYNYGNSTRYFYQNGQLYTSNSYNTSHQPSRWVLNSPGTCIGIVCDAGYDADIEWYAYRTAIFNTVLDVNTINTIIQSY